MRRLLVLRVADFGVVGERDDSRAEFGDFGFQGVDLRLLPEDDLAELLEIVLQMSQQKFDSIFASVARSSFSSRGRLAPRAFASSASAR